MASKIAMPKASDLELEGKTKKSQFLSKQYFFLSLTRPKKKTFFSCNFFFLINNALYSLPDPQI